MFLQATTQTLSPPWGMVLPVVWSFWILCQDITDPPPPISSSPAAVFPGISPGVTGLITIQAPQRPSAVSYSSQPSAVCHSTWSSDVVYSTWSSDVVYSTWSSDVIYSTWSSDVVYSTWSSDVVYSTWLSDVFYFTWPSPVEDNLVYTEIWWLQITTTRHGFNLKSGFRKIWWHHNMVLELKLNQVSWKYGVHQTFLYSILLGRQLNPSLFCL